MPGIENASIDFDVQTLAPTHKLLIGTPGNSNALVIARRLGLPEEVIADAVRQPRDEDEDAIALVDQLQAARKAAVKDRRQAEASRAAAERLEAEWRQKAEELGERVQDHQGQAGADPRAQLRHLQQELDSLRRSDGSRHALLQSLRRLSAQLDGSLQGVQGKGDPPAVERSPKPGDQVYVRSLDRVGVLSRIDGRTVVVQLGALPMTVGREDVDAEIPPEREG